MQYLTLNEQLQDKVADFCKTNGIKEAICIFSTEWNQVSYITISKGRQTVIFNELHIAVKKLLEGSPLIKPSK